MNLSKKVKTPNLNTGIRSPQETCVAVKDSTSASRVEIDPSLVSVSCSLDSEEAASVTTDPGAAPAEVLLAGAVRELAPPPEEEAALPAAPDAAAAAPAAAAAAATVETTATAVVVVCATAATAAGLPRGSKGTLGALSSPVAPIAGLATGAPRISSGREKSSRLPRGLSVGGVISSTTAGTPFAPGTALIVISICCALRFVWSLVTARDHLVAADLPKLCFKDMLVTTSLPTSTRRILYSPWAAIPNASALTLVPLKALRPRYCQRSPV